MDTFQKTLAAPCSLTGVGLHSGKEVRLRLLPAEVDTGILFRRTDQEGEASLIKGRYDCVSDMRMCTELKNAWDVKVSTVEHLLAALAGLEIDNIVIELSSPEVPIMDGSAVPFMQEILETGLKKQEKIRPWLCIKKTVEIREETRFVRLEPTMTPSFSFSLDFFGGRDGLKPQAFQYDCPQGNFLKDIAPARTFGFYEDAQRLQAAGLARGASLDNAVVIQEGRILNEGGLRFEDECVRHKILDAVGDLYLAGGPLWGAYTSHNGGHEMNNRLLHLLFETPDAYEWRPYEAFDAVLRAVPAC